MLGQGSPLRLANLEDEMVRGFLYHYYFWGTWDSGEVQHCHLCTDKSCSPDSPHLLSVFLFFAQCPWRLTSTYYTSWAFSSSGSNSSFTSKKDQQKEDSGAGGETSWEWLFPLFLLCQLQRWLGPCKVPLPAPTPLRHPLQHPLPLPCVPLDLGLLSQAVNSWVPPHSLLVSFSSLLCFWNESLYWIRFS